MDWHSYLVFLINDEAPSMKELERSVTSPQIMELETRVNELYAVLIPCTVISALVVGVRLVHLPVRLFSRKRMRADSSMNLGSTCA